MGSILINSWKLRRLREELSMGQLCVRKTGLFSQPCPRGQPEVPMRRTKEDNQHLLVWRTGLGLSQRAGREGLAGRESCWAVLEHWCEASNSERGKSWAGSWRPGLSHP